MKRARLHDYDLTPDIIANASRLLKSLGDLNKVPLGTERTFSSAGKNYVCVLERHYHTPGGPVKPWGQHKGFSTFEVVDDGNSATVPDRTKTSVFSLGVTSNARLQGVHRDLVKVVRRAIEITTIDFSVIEGVRSLDRQRELKAAGKTQTTNSRHLTGHAVDLAPYENGMIHWDWPRFNELAISVKQAAKDVNVPVEWGGNWPGFPDGPHWQLPWSKYP